jgi:hypothetical protein
MGQNSEICESFLSRHNGMWELSLQPLEKYEWLKNININFCNTSTLTVISCDSCSQNGFEHERIRKSKVCFSLTYPWKQNSLKVSEKCKCFMSILHLSFYACSLSFSWFSTPKTDRQQSHYSDGSNLNSCFLVFNFLRHKSFNYIYIACSNV